MEKNKSPSAEAISISVSIIPSRVIMKTNARKVLLKVSFREIRNDLLPFNDPTFYQLS